MPKRLKAGVELTLCCHQLNMTAAIEAVTSTRTPHAGHGTVVRRPLDSAIAVDGHRQLWPGQLLPGSCGTIIVRTQRRTAVGLALPALCRCLLVQGATVVAVGAISQCWDSKAQLLRRTLLQQWQRQGVIPLLPDLVDIVGSYDADPLVMP